VINRALVIRLVQWLGWVFENKERKKERKPSLRKKESLQGRENETEKDTGGASDMVKAKSSGEDPMATESLVSNLPHPRVNKTKQHTKAMAFFETPFLHKARGGQHQPGPTLPPFHIHAPFPTSSPCSYLITEVLQFEYLKRILGPKLTMHLATTEAIQHAAHGQSMTQAVSYSLRYD